VTGGPANCGLSSGIRSRREIRVEETFDIFFKTSTLKVNNDGGVDATIF
jgi:hypothetical protein